MRKHTLEIRQIFTREKKHCKPCKKKGFCFEAIIIMASGIKKSRL